MDSVLSQTYQNWECIIIDDHSTDSSLRIANEFSDFDERFKVLSRPTERPKGANACRNEGFRRSTGEYIIFLDADDLLEERALEQRVKSVSKDKGIGYNLYVFTTFERENSNNLENANFEIYNVDPEVPSKDNYIKLFLKMDWPWQTTSVLWPRLTFSLIGGFDESLHRFQDPEIHIRALVNPRISLKRVFNLPPDHYYRKESGASKTYPNFEEIQIINYALYVEKILNTLGKYPNLEEVEVKKCIRNSLKKIFNRVYHREVKLARKLFSLLKAELLNAGMYSKATIALVQVLLLGGINSPSKSHEKIINKITFHAVRLIMKYSR